MMNLPLYNTYTDQEGWGERGFVLRQYTEQKILMGKGKDKDLHLPSPGHTQIYTVRLKMIKSRADQLAWQKSREIMNEVCLRSACGKGGREGFYSLAPSSKKHWLHEKSKGVVTPDAFFSFFWHAAEAALAR